MTPVELATRALAYVTQAEGRLNEVESKGVVLDSAIGEWVSLRRNIESAKSDLETLTRAG